MATTAFTVVVVFLAVLVIMSPAPVAEAAERGNHTCSCEGYSKTCIDCEGGRCCSPWGYCGSSVGYCTPCYCDGGVICFPCHCLGNCPAAVENQQLPVGYDHSTNETLVATYDPNLDNVSSSSSSASSVAGRDTRRVNDHYGSATICSGPSSSTTASTNIVPGECLQVTNPKNGKQAMVRIIKKKQCSNTTSLALDYDVFQQLDDDDTSGSGNATGHLSVSYKYVSCVDN